MHLFNRPLPPTNPPLASRIWLLESGRSFSAFFPRNSGSYAAAIEVPKAWSVAAQGPSNRNFVDATWRMRGGKRHVRRAANERTDYVFWFNGPDGSAPGLRSNLGSLSKSDRVVNIDARYRTVFSMLV